MGKDKSRLGMRKGRKKNGSTFLENQKRHRAQVKKTRDIKRANKTDEGEEGEGDAGPRKAFKFQNFSEQVFFLLSRIISSTDGDWCIFKVLILCLISGGCS